MPAERLLLVEGGDDEHFVKALMMSFPILPTFEVERCRGVDTLLKNAPLRLKEDGRQSLGVILDANTDPVVRWIDISTAFAGHVPNMPQQPVSEGTILDDINGVRLGIWLMPDNDTPGELEDLLVHLVRDSYDWILAQKFVADVFQNSNKPSRAKIRKSEIRAWLAVQETPGLLGEAMRSGALDLEKPDLTPFLRWLHDLFTD